MDGRVGRLHCQYRMIGGSFNSFAATNRLDRIARSGELAEACNELFDKADGGSAVFVLRRLNVPVVLNLKTHWDDRTLAQPWGREIVRSALRQVARGEDSANYVRFEDEDELVARFITDLAHGEAWNRWFYNCFARLRSLPVADAIESVLLDSRDRLAGVLVRLQHMGGLDLVLGVLDPVALDRIWTLGLNPDATAPEAELRTPFAAALRLARHLRQSAAGLEISGERLFQEYLATGPIFTDWRDRSALALAVVDAFEFLCKQGFLGRRPLASGVDRSSLTELTGMVAQFDWLETDLLVPAIDKLSARYYVLDEGVRRIQQTRSDAKAGAAAATEPKQPFISEQIETAADPESGDRSTFNPQKDSILTSRDAPEISIDAVETPTDAQSKDRFAREAGTNSNTPPANPNDVLALTGDTKSHEIATAAEPGAIFEQVTRAVLEDAPAAKGAQTNESGPELNENLSSPVRAEGSEAEPAFKPTALAEGASQKPPPARVELSPVAEATNDRAETERAIPSVIAAASWIFKGPDYRLTSRQERELHEYLRHFCFKLQTNAERTLAVIAAVEFLSRNSSSQSDFHSKLLGWQESSAWSIEFKWLDLEVLVHAAAGLAVAAKSKENESSPSQTAPLRTPDTTTPRRKRLLTDLAQTAAAERSTMKIGANNTRATALRLYARLVSDNADWAGDLLVTEAIEGLLATASMVDPVAGTYKPDAARRSGEAGRAIEISRRFIRAFGASGLDLARAVAVGSSAPQLNPTAQAGVPAREVWQANYDSECAGVLLLIRAMLDARLAAITLAEGYPLIPTILTLGICWCGNPALFQGRVDLALATLAGQDQRATVVELRSVWREVSEAAHLRFQNRLLSLLSARGLLGGEGLEYHRFPLHDGRVAILAGAINANVWPLVRIANDEQAERAALASLEETWLTATGMSEVARQAGSSSTETLEATLNTVLRECLEDHLDQTLAAWTMAITSVSLLRLWSAWLKQFSGSSTPYLLKNFVRRPGRVRWVKDGILVELAEQPLDIVLEMAGYFASFRAHTNPWQWQVHFRKQS